MKYMGSKRALLKNGLGSLLLQEAAAADRFIDLFAGSGAVATYVAERTKARVVAVDLQKYSSVLSGAIITRTQQIDPRFIATFESRVRAVDVPSEWAALEEAFFENPTKSAVVKMRKAASNADSAICRAYGGHYFGLRQAALLDASLSLLPHRLDRRRVLLAALVSAASKSVAAPGHTAQPFAPTESGLPHIAHAWSKDPLSLATENAQLLCRRHAAVAGSTYVADARRSLAWIRPTPEDVVFIDPPYTAVQYSRFYHVLETLAGGECGPVTGRGRYPRNELRPRSDYSMRARAADALNELLNVLSEAGARVVLTFPSHDCSNGMSGESVIATARESFQIEKISIENTFSTLGGTASGRGARRSANELVLVLTPTKRSI